MRDKQAILVIGANDATGGAVHGNLHQQSRDAWTHEMELRPWMETF